MTLDEFVEKHSVASLARLFCFVGWQAKKNRLSVNCPSCSRVIPLSYADLLGVMSGIAPSCPDCGFSSNDYLEGGAA